MRRQDSRLARLASAFLHTVARGKDSAQPSSPRVIPLWPDGAPGSETRRGEREKAHHWWVRNVHDPSLTAFFPRASRASGTAIVIVPGGGHRELVFDAEGVAPARYLADLGVAAFVLKYRLSREEGSTYGLEEHTGADIQRAMRLVRSRAGEWSLDPERIGVMGWSAGCELAAMVAHRPGAGNLRSADPVERANARPDFAILIYPGAYGIPDTILSDAPPAFILAAADDEAAAANVVDLLGRYRRAGASAEVHLYAEGHHGFNMGDRSPLVSIRNWPQRMADWLTDRGWLTRTGR
jgi:acetyl esterase/lipase